MLGLEWTLGTSPRDSYERCERGHIATLILNSSGGGFECAGCGLSFDSEAARLLCECGPWCVGCLMKNERNRRQHEEFNGSLTVAGVAAAFVSGLHNIPPFRRGLLTLYECPRNNCRAAPSTAVFPCPCEHCGLNVQPLSGYQCLSCSPPFFSICVNCCVHSSVTRRGGPEGRVSSSPPRRRSVVDQDGGYENGDGAPRLDAHLHNNNGETARTRMVTSGTRRRAASTNDAGLPTEFDVSEGGRGALSRGGGGDDTELENIFLNQMQGLRAQLERLALRLNEQELQAPDCNPDPSRFTIVAVNGLYCPPRTPHHPKMVGMDALNAMLGSRGRGQGATHSNATQHEEDEARQGERSFDTGEDSNNNAIAVPQQGMAAVVPSEEGAFLPSVLGNITTTSSRATVSVSGVHDDRHAERGDEQLLDGGSSAAHMKSCHPLACSHYGRLPWTCDDCGKDFSARSVGLQCRLCHYDKCLKCAMKVNGIVPLCPLPHKCRNGIPCPEKMIINTYSGPQECVQCGSGFGLWQGYVCKHEHNLGAEEERGPMDKECSSRGGGGEGTVRPVAICVSCAMHNHNEANPSPLPPPPSIAEHQHQTVDIDDADDLMKVLEERDASKEEPYHFEPAPVKLAFDGKKVQAVKRDEGAGSSAASRSFADPPAEAKPTSLSPFAVCSSSEECSICLMPCNESPDLCDDEEDNSRLAGEEDASTNVAKERLAVRVSCPGHHIFHTLCIAAWLQTHQVCPVCRTDIAGRCL